MECTRRIDRENRERRSIRYFGLDNLRAVAQSLPQSWELLRDLVHAEPLHEKALFSVPSVVERSTNSRAKRRLKSREHWAR